jgi:hypothetical protein
MTVRPLATFSKRPAHPHPQAFYFRYSINVLHSGERARCLLMVR